LQILVATVTISMHCFSKIPERYDILVVSFTHIIQAVKRALCDVVYVSRRPRACVGVLLRVDYLLHCALSLARRSVLSPVLSVAGGGRCLWVCYHDNSKLRASIFTKLGLYVKVVTISS